MKIDPQQLPFVDPEKLSKLRDYFSHAREEVKPRSLQAAAGLTEKEAILVLLLLEAFKAGEAYLVFRHRTCDDPMVEVLRRRVSDGWPTSFDCEECDRPVAAEDLTAEWMFAPKEDLEIG